MEPTLNAHSAIDLSPRTYADVEEPGVGMLDTYRYHPWRAPGHAPVIDPCGVAGGSNNPNLPPEKGGIAPPGYEKGERGSALSPVAPTIWKRHNPDGTPGTVEVAWALVANHGGG